MSRAPSIGGPGVMVGEGDVEIAKANLRATTSAGEIYDNRYVFVAECGRIAELREHVDPKCTAGFFGA